MRDAFLHTDGRGSHAIPSRSTRRFASTKPATHHVQHRCAESHDEFGDAVKDYWLRGDTVHSK